MPSLGSAPRSLCFLIFFAQGHVLSQVGRSDSLALRRELEPCDVGLDPCLCLEGTGHHQIFMPLRGTHEHGHQPGIGQEGFVLHGLLRRRKVVVHTVRDKKNILWKFLQPLQIASCDLG